MFSAADAVQSVVPGSGFLQSADQPQQGRFPRPVFSYQPIDCAFRDMHGKIVQRSMMAVNLCQSLCLENIIQNITSF